MPYEKLVTYIKEQLENGFSEEQIKQTLAKAGYKQEMINQGFSLASMVPSEDESLPEPFGEASADHMQEAPFTKAQDQLPETHPGADFGSQQQNAQQHQQVLQQKPSIQQSSPTVQHPARYNTLAIFGFFFSLTIILSLIGFILSGIALVKLKKAGYQEKGKGLAMTGLIVGFVFTVVSLVFLLVIIPSLKEYLNYSPI
ncbi:DUF4190 domain-containing protein [Candidatus Woesearchaeota archaeon]|nr:DUF4190 domain-containing protein [Candidatus Woesearchaeota archaeon]